MFSNKNPVHISQLSHACYMLTLLDLITFFTSRKWKMYFTAKLQLSQSLDYVTHVCIRKNRDCKTERRKKNIFRTRVHLSDSIATQKWDASFSSEFVDLRKMSTLHTSRNEQRTRKKTQSILTHSRYITHLQHSSVTPHTFRKCVGLKTIYVVGYYVILQHCISS
jgi:hypothetical protein